METIDIVLLVLLAIGAYRGFTTGLLMQLLGIIAFFLAIIGGFHLMHIGTDLLEPYMEGYEGMIPFISFIVIFILIIVVINLIGKGIKSVIDMTLLGSFDDIAGAIAGFLKWALVLSLLIWLFDSFDFIPMEQYYEDTKVFPLVAAIAPFLLDSVSGLLPYLQDLTPPGSDLPQA